MTIEIPAERAAWHGGADFYKSGAKLAGTLEILGGLTGSDRVLDVGAGTGRVAIGIGERYGWTNQYLGLEIQTIDVDICQRQITSVHPNFRFAHLDVYNVHYNNKGKVQPDEIVFPVEDATFDFAFATSLFTHMYTRETAHYLKEVARALRPGGTFLSTWFVIDDAARATIAAGKARFQFAIDRGDGTFDQDQAKPGNAVGFDIAAAERIFAEAGFSFEFFRGRWASDEPTSRGSQDAIVARKL